MKKLFLAVSVHPVLSVPVLRIGSRKRKISGWRVRPCPTKPAPDFQLGERAFFFFYCQASRFGFNGLTPTVQTRAKPVDLRRIVSGIYYEQEKRQSKQAKRYFRGDWAKVY